MRKPLIALGVCGVLAFFAMASFWLLSPSRPTYETASLRSHNSTSDAQLQQELAKRLNELQIERQRAETQRVELERDRARLEQERAESARQSQAEAAAKSKSTAVAAEAPRQEELSKRLSELQSERQRAEAARRNKTGIAGFGTVEPALPAPPTLASASPKDELKELEAIAERNCREKMRKLGVVGSGPCIDVSSIVDGLAVGTYAFNKPATAFVGEPFRLLLALKTSDKQDIKESFVGLMGAVTERQGKFAQSVEATLRGDDLAIEPAGAQLRTATMNEAVEWEWTITPKSGGQKTMIIEVAANIEAGPDKHKVKVKTLREAIVIQVSVLQQIKMYVAEANGYVVAASATITAIAGVIGFVPSIRNFILSYLRRRRKSARYGR